MGHLWHQYWSWTGGNVGAMPLQAVITVAATLLLRRPLARSWHWLVGDQPTSRTSAGHASASSIART